MFFIFSDSAFALISAEDSMLNISRAIFFILVVIFIIMSCIIAKKKGKPNIFYWGAMGGVFGPFAIAYLLLIPAATAKTIEPLNSRVNYFINIGLLDKGQTPENLTQIIARNILEEWGEEFKHADPYADLLILKYGEAKIWWKDTEADVLNGNAVYVNTLKELAALTNGIFSPKNIVETWNSDTGPIKINFKQNGEHYEITPEYLEDYIDIDILKQINKLFPCSEYAFEMIAPFDQTAFVLWLDKKTKDGLIKRGWKFAW